MIYEENWVAKMKWDAAGTSRVDVVEKFINSIPYGDLWSPEEKAKANIVDDQDPKKKGKLLLLIKAFRFAHRAAKI